MKERQMESLSDIERDLRDRADCAERYGDRETHNDGVATLLRSIADRIEAIDSADAWRSLYTPGNAAAMREALEYVLHFDATDETAMEDGLTDAERIAEYADHIEECQKKANAALSAPARNCDLYNDVEDSWQDYKQFRRQTGEDIYFDMVHFWPFAKWLLAPAAERKGEN